MNQPDSWPPELDALTAAPEHHSLVLENEKVRVLETRVGPGEKVSLHTHQWAAVTHIIAWSDFVRRDENGDVVLDSRELSEKPKPGSTMWSAPLGLHTLENVGDGVLHVLGVEIKP